MASKQTILTKIKFILPLGHVFSCGVISLIWESQVVHWSAKLRTTAEGEQEEGSYTQSPWKYPQGLTQSSCHMTSFHALQGQCHRQCAELYARNVVCVLEALADPGTDAKYVHHYFTLNTLYIRSTGILYGRVIVERETSHCLHNTKILLKAAVVEVMINMREKHS